MKILFAIALLTTPFSFAGEWVSMFDGKTLEGWKVNSENPETFSVEEGAIKVKGPRAHLFYGEDGNAKFKNFEFECECKTAKGANAGIFIHTKYQDSGWPSQGYECQVNATQQDWRKTGSIYSFQDLRDPGHKDDEWFIYNIKVEGKKITVTINGKVVNEYTEPEDHKEKTKRLGEGTIALQGHDPGSLVYFRKLRIKKLD
jgi:hypothetical protein